MKRATTLLACTLLAGCQAMMYGTAADMNALSLGMSRADVVQRMGAPISTDATANSETLHYRKMERVGGWWPTGYLVKLEGGKVVAFGKEPE